MYIDDQVCSLELCQRLKILGVRQNSYFNYELRNEKPLYFEIYHSKATSCAHKYYSAFTVTELLELLPAVVIHGEPPFDNYYLMIEKRTVKNIQYIVSYCCDSYATDKSYEHYGVKPFATKILCKTYDENIQDALANILIHLIENKLI